MSSFSHRFLPTIKALQVQNWGLAHLLAFIIRFAKINSQGIHILWRTLPHWEIIWIFAPKTQIEFLRCQQVNQQVHNVWKSLKMSHLNFSVLPFSTISGNTVWLQSLGFQKLTKLDHFWHFWWIFVKVCLHSIFLILNAKFQPLMLTGLAVYREHTISHLVKGQSSVAGNTCRLQSS